MKALKYTMALGTAIVLAATVNVHAADKAAVNPFFASLSATPSAELPAKAADLVSHADAKKQKQTTIDVVKAAVGLNPAAAPAIVGSIAHSTPAMAATAAAAAVSVLPNHAAAIARAAAAAAHDSAGKIVEAVCKESPASYQEVATAVAEVVPSASKDILKGVAAAIPQLRSAIYQTVATDDSKVPSVGTVLGQVAQTQSATSTFADASVPALPRGPSVTPPTVPISSTPSALDPGTGGEVPTGGRYATP
jgi:hypothetical protein